jgi:hypothetical protein
MSALLFHFRSVPSNAINVQSNPAQSDLIRCNSAQLEPPPFYPIPVYSFMGE